MISVTLVFLLQSFESFVLVQVFVLAAGPQNILIGLLSGGI